jgi:hypothetical protein
MIRISVKNAIDYSTGPEAFKSNARALATCVTVRTRGAQPAAVAIERPPRGLLMV